MYEVSFLPYPNLELQCAHATNAMLSLMSLSLISLSTAQTTTTTTMSVGIGALPRGRNGPKWIRRRDQQAEYTATDRLDGAGKSKGGIDVSLSEIRPVYYRRTFNSSQAVSLFIVHTTRYRYLWILCTTFILPQSLAQL
jgi:hypothetical protein